MSESYQIYVLVISDIYITYNTYISHTSFMYAALQMSRHTHSCVWRLFSHLNCMKDPWHTCISTSLTYIFDHTHSGVRWLLNHVMYVRDSHIHLDISTHMHFNELRVIFAKEPLIIGLFCWKWRTYAIHIYISTSPHICISTSLIHVFRQTHSNMCGDSSVIFDSAVIFNSSVVLRVWRTHVTHTHLDVINTRIW